MTDVTPPATTPAPAPTDPSWVAEEPVIAASITAAVLGAVGGLAITKGWIGSANESQLVEWLTPTVTGLVLLGIGFVVRKFVTPIAKLVK